MIPGTGALARSAMIIILTKVRKIYRVGVERVRALDGVDLSIAANEYVAVMGPSGSGKSTLMNVLGCLDRPTSGDYVLDGERTSTMSSAALAEVRNRRIGFVFQSFELMPRFTAAKNVALPLIYGPNPWWGRARQAKEALARVGLSARGKHRPNQLSGGEKQRVAIARAIIGDPAILLADEPTGNLDSKTSDGILDLFDQLHHQGQTIIVVTHEASVSQRAQRVVRMRDGRIESDSPTGRDAALQQEARS